MSVVARFYVSESKRMAYNPQSFVITLQAVSRGEENKEWASATPQGQISMTINNGPAGKWFDDRLGKDVLITFDAPEDDDLHPTPYSA